MLRKDVHCCSVIFACSRLPKFPVKSCDKICESTEEVQCFEFFVLYFHSYMYQYYLTSIIYLFIYFSIMIAYLHTKVNKRKGQIIVGLIACPDNQKKIFNLVDIKNTKKLYTTD